MALLGSSSFLYEHKSNFKPMKRKIVMTGLAVAALLVFAFKSGEKETYKTLEIGETAPMIDSEMESTKGQDMTLKSLKGNNGTLVIFSCNTCPFVIAWEDRYPELKELAEDAEIGFALINSNEAKRNGDDSMEKMQQHAEEKGYPEIPYLVDNNSALANAFGAKTTPHVFLFDANWSLVYEGAIDDNHESAKAAKQHYLKDALKNLEQGKTIDPSNTKSIGCSIKRVKS